MLYVYILITLIFSAFFSGSEIAYLSADKLRLELDRGKGGLRAKILDILYRHPDRYITMVLLGNNIALVIYGMLMAPLLEPLFYTFTENDMLVLTLQSIVSTILILFMGEFIPKIIFRTNPNWSMQGLAIPLFIIYLLLYPFVFIINLISQGLLRRRGDNSISTTLSTVDLEYYLEYNQSQDGQGEADTEVKFIQNAISFPSLKVRDCMIPRNEIIAVERGMPLAYLEDKFVRSGLGKLIVYRDNIDEIIGYIHSSETFRGENWAERIVPPIYVPESMFASKLMTQLMQQKRSIAIVIDELGGTAGMVTLEDIVEEIFGDIEDEHDRQKRICKQLDERTYLLSGRLELDHINEQFSLDLPEDEDFMTIAGLILHHHPSIPSIGEVIDIAQWRFEIVRSTSTKIVLVKLTLL